MSGASELNPMKNGGYQPRKIQQNITDAPPRYPKACKVQMFSKHEQIWLDALYSRMRSRYGTTDVSVLAADEALKAFKERFE